MRKIMLLMVVITIGATVMRQVGGFGGDNVRQFGWTGSLSGGTTGAPTPVPAPEPQAAAPRPRTGLPTISAISTSPVTRGTGGASSATATPGVPRGADGIVTPELMRYLNPSFLPGQPGGANPGASGSQAPGTATASPGRAQMIQTLIEQAKSNPTALGDQFGAVAKALNGK